jgi:hypothetical protein
MQPVKVVFAMRLSVTTQLSLEPSDSPNDPPSPLVIAKDGESKDWTIEFEEGEWKTDLYAGDYVIHLPLPEGDWFGGTVTISTTEQVEMIVHHDSTTTAWGTNSSVIGGGDDPKDPWPPPTGQTYTPSNATWMVSGLQGIASIISNPRSAPQMPDDE